MIENVSAEPQLPVQMGEIIPQTVEPQLPPGWKRWLASFAVAGVIAGGTAAVIEHDAPHHVSNIVEEVADIGVTITPKVSSAGTEALITTNNVLRDVGPYALLAGLLIYGGLWAAKRRNDKLDEIFEYIKPGKERGIAHKILPAAIIGSVAVASGIGDEAGSGANEPVEVLEQVLTADQNDAYVITQHERVIPFSHSGVTEEKANRIRIMAGGGNSGLVPYIFELGDIYFEGNTSNPSSAPIVALPSERIKDAFGVDMGKIDNCSDMSVIVSSQLGAKRGDTVVVEGMESAVARTIDVHPGLDRVAVVGSLEQMHRCVFEDEPFSGAVVLGIDDPEILQEQMIDAGITYSVREFEELKETYADFWDRSVKPPEMQLVLLVLGVGMAGVTYIRNTEVLRHKKDIAALIANGVQRSTLRHAENLRSLKSSVWGTAYAVVPAIMLTGMTNSSQYGLNQATDIRSLGTGFLAFTAVSALGSRGPNKLINQLDVAEEIRS